MGRSGYQHIVHTLAPVYDAASRVLILGSLPSAASRAQGFYYGHRQNRFWRVLAAVYGEDIPGNIGTKKHFLLSHGIALWDVIRECDIVGSSDVSIKNAAANDISAILRAAEIRLICTNGATAHALYDRYILPAVGREALRLPSTSPANAAWSLERLTAAWAVIRETAD